jgi:hypothetical protein
MVKIIQPSLAGGEVSPAIGARVDIDKYKSSLEVCENAFVQVHGGVSNRPGFEFIAEVKDGSQATRIIPFEYNTEQTYILEFGNNYMRVHKDGGQVLKSSGGTGAITGATQANPVVITAIGHPHANGEDVYVNAVVGMTELNGRTMRVANITANTYELTDFDGNNIDSSAYTAYTSGGASVEVFELTTTYTAAEVFDLKFVQSADVMTLLHPSHAPTELTRTGHDVWTLTDIVFQPQQTYPTGLLAAANTTGAETHTYVVTAVNRDNAEESLRAVGTAQTISGATQTDPVVLTITGNTFADGDEIHVDGVVGMTELNGERFRVTNQATNTVDLQALDKTDIDGTGYTAYGSAGSAYPTKVTITNGAATKDNTITWTDVSTAESYNIYFEKDGIFGFIGRSEIDSFTDDNIDADLEDTPPRTRNPFVGTDDYPSVAGYLQQRRIFARSNNNPQRIWFTQTANHYNLAVSSPAKDDDAITVTIAALKVNEIRHLVPLGDMIVLTSGGEWKISGIDDVITPGGIQIEPQTYYGATELPPIVAGDVVIYMQPGQTVRDLAYKFETDAYSGNDVSILARHIFDNYTIVDWTYTQAPHSIIWCVRDDGTMAALTYIREQEVYGWSRHTTDGLFKSVAAVQEGDDDFLYAVVERTINSRTVKYIERLHDHDIDALEDAFHVDSGLSLDSPVVITGYTNANPVVITTSTPHGLENGNTIDIEGIKIADTAQTQGWSYSTEVDGEGYTVANKTATTFELQLNAANVDGTSFATYHSGGNVRRAITTISGLWHLEGESIVGLANGYVVRNLTVTNGSITLPNASSRVHLGLDFVSEIKTLRLDAGSVNPTAASRPKKISHIALQLEKTLGLWTGPDVDHMREAKFGLPAKWGQAPDAVTGLKSLTMSPSWNKHGQIVIQQRDPLPMTILSITPEVTVGSSN